MIIFFDITFWALQKIAFPVFFIFAIALICAAIYREKQSKHV